MVREDIIFRLHLGIRRLVALTNRIHLHRTPLHRLRRRTRRSSPTQAAAAIVSPLATKPPSLEPPFLAEDWASTLRLSPFSIAPTVTRIVVAANISLTSHRTASQPHRCCALGAVQPPPLANSRASVPPDNLRWHRRATTPPWPPPPDARFVGRNPRSGKPLNRAVVSAGKPRRCLPRCRPARRQLARAAARRGDEEARRRRGDAMW